MTLLEFDTERARAVLAASYDFSVDLGAWAAGVHAALAPVLDAGQGTLSTLVSFQAGGLTIERLQRAGAASFIHEAVVRLSALISRERLREAFFNGRVLGASSEHYGQADFQMLVEGAKGTRSRDAIGFCINDGVDYGFMVVAPTRERHALPREPRAVVRRLGEHVATGLRLARVIQSAALSDPAVEAIFDSDGTAQHVSGLLRSPGALERLRQTVVARSRAGDAALGDAPAWEAVVAGRWSLVDRFDVDRRRFVVAYRNPPGVLDPRRLSPREECVATLAALGRSNKEIAIELGTSDSSVANALAAALAKLGLEARTLLPIFWRDLRGRAWVLDGADARLIALGGRLESDGLSVLSPAERAVAKGVLAGLPDRDIARARRCSRRTISNHTAAVYRKLGVHSRTELASKLAEH